MDYIMGVNKFVAFAIICFGLTSNAYARPDNIFQFIKDGPKILAVEYTDAEDLKSFRHTGVFGEILGIILEHKDGPVRVTIDSFGADHELDFDFLERGEWKKSNISLTGEQDNIGSRLLIERALQAATTSYANQGFHSRTFQVTKGVKDAKIGLNAFPIELNAAMENKDGTLQLKQFELRINEIKTTMVLRKKSIKETRYTLNEARYVNQQGSMLKIVYQDFSLNIDYVSGEAEINFLKKRNIAGIGNVSGVTNTRLRRFTFGEPAIIRTRLTNYSEEIPTRVINHSDALLPKSLCDLLVKEAQKQGVTN